MKYLFLIALLCLLLFTITAIDNYDFKCCICFMEKDIYKLSLCGLKIPYSEKIKETDISNFINNTLEIKHQHKWRFLAGQEHYTRLVELLRGGRDPMAFISEPKQATEVLRKIIELDNRDKTRANTIVFLNNLDTVPATFDLNQVFNELLSIHGEKILSSKIEWDKWWTENEHLFQEAEKRAKEYLKEHGED